MVPEIRKRFNAQFTEEKYKALLDEINRLYPGQLDFRVAETPIFVPKDFTQKMFDACDHILDVIESEDYKKQSSRAIPENLRVPNEDAHPQFIAFDFGICQSADGGLEPQLIELQGFPSLFAFQILDPELVRTDRLKPGEGVNGDPHRATAELGALGVDLVVNETVVAIKQAVARH